VTVNHSSSDIGGSSPSTPTQKIKKMTTDTKVLDDFKRRMDKLGIECKFSGNYPWIYLDYINGKRVTERFCANHGFTVAFLPIRPGQKMELTDIGEIMKLIRKYK
jgi:hypothetical protein